jgi:hypothetical protein
MKPKDELLDRARAVVDAYRARFESRGQPNQIFGPIDDEVVALEIAIAKALTK